MAQNVTVIKFVDAESKDEAIAIVRVVLDRVGLCLSLRDGRDVEAFLSMEDAHRLVGALEKATLQAGHAR